MSDDSIGVAVCNATHSYSILGPVEIPAAWLEETIKNPDAIQLAYSLGRLDILTIFMGCVGLGLGVVALLGFWMIRNAALSRARQAAHDAAPGIVADYLKLHSVVIFRECMSETEMISSFHREVIRLGIRDAAEADDVDDDAQLREA